MKKETRTMRLETNDSKLSFQRLYRITRDHGRNRKDKGFGDTYRASWGTDLEKGRSETANWFQRQRFEDLINLESEWEERERGKGAWMWNPKLQEREGEST